MSTLSLQNLDKIYDNGFHAVHNFCLDIKENEFIVLVGPSGCGKSTTLRMIAGLESISAGNILINGKKVNHLAPIDRGIAMVFQTYALYPHMSVYENLAFGLKLRDIDYDEIDERVRSTAQMLGLSEYLDRKPRELSGGQRQRVALGRAIVRNSDIYLMDEPLSNLDANLRVAMRTEIKLIHEKTKATTVYVTHDQVEAMTMADRIVVMKDGYIQQIGTPKELYHRPANMFVAGFIGDPPMNFIRGHLDDKGEFVIHNDLQTHIPFDAKLNKQLAAWKGKEIVMGIRPEDFILENCGDYCNFSVEVQVNELLGDTINLYTFLGNQRLVIKSLDKRHKTKAGKIPAAIKLDDLHFFNPESGQRIE